MHGYVHRTAAGVRGMTHVGGARMANLNNGPSLKRRAVLIRLSEIEYRRIKHEAAERGISVGDLARNLFRLVSPGTLPAPVQRSGGAEG